MVPLQAKAMPVSEGKGDAQKGKSKLCSKGPFPEPHWHRKGGHWQVEPLVPDWPQCADIFLEPDPQQIVKYPRVLPEPSVRCPHGHSVFLSRLPYQSQCVECKNLGGWPQYMLRDYYTKILSTFGFHFFLFVFVFFFSKLVGELLVFLC